MGDFRKYKIGQTTSTNQKFTYEKVKAFAELTGDNNPLHLNEEFAKNTFFKKCIVHGTFYSVMIGTILGTKLPGSGTILVSNNYQYIHPVYIGDKITAEVKIIDLNYEKKMITLQASCKNQAGIEVLKGSVVTKKIY